VPADPAGQYQWLRVQWAIVDSWIGARKARSDLPEAPADPDQGGQDMDPLLGAPG